ncbi:MAG: hypothetical protein WC819_05355 [Parcubacteria group bacterium]|jgi:hypothetical protein
MNKVIQRTQAIRRGGGNHLATAEFELRQIADRLTFQSDLKNFFITFKDDVRLIAKVISMGIATAETLQAELSQTFRFNYTLCESAAKIHKDDQDFIVWLIASMHKRNSPDARRLFSRVIMHLSTDNLWLIDAATNDPKIAAILTPVMDKRHATLPLAA